MTGVIGVVLAPVSKPSPCISRLKYSVLAHNRSTRSVELSSRSSPARQAATSGTVMADENRNGRPRWRSQSMMRCGPATTPPTTPNALDSVPTSTSTCPCSPK